MGKGLQENGIVPDGDIIGLNGGGCVSEKSSVLRFGQLRRRVIGLAPVSVDWRRLLSWG